MSLFRLRKSTISAAILFCSSTCFLSIAQAKGLWFEQGSSAFIQMDFSAMPDAHVMFMVSFSKKLDCKPEIEMMLSKGDNLGKGISQRWIDKELVVMVDDAYKFSGKTVYAKYENAFSFKFLGSDEALSRIKSGRTIKAKMPTDQIPEIRFSLDGAKESIETIQTKCKS